MRCEARPITTTPTHNQATLLQFVEYRLCTRRPWQSPKYLHPALSSLADCREEGWGFGFLCAYCCIGRQGRGWVCESLCAYCGVSRGTARLESCR